MGKATEGGGDLLTRLEWALANPNEEGAFRDDSDFSRWAMEIHAHQLESNPILRAYWSGRGSDAVSGWADIPPVPASAFKAVGFGPVDAPEAVFRTSGTSTGGTDRGEHRIGRLALYRAAARGNYLKCLFPSFKSIRVLSLIPDAEVAPDSSLARMVSFMAEEPQVATVAWGFPEGGRVDMTVSEEALLGKEPLLILSTAFALVQLLDGLGPRRLVLPAGSGMMETGGFKGRSAEVGRGDLYRRVERHLGVPEESIVGEYGMTELLSQSYDGVLGSASLVAHRAHRFPPWVRTSVLDPVTLRPAEVGQVGLLAHYDLANAESVCHVLTEDVGMSIEGGGFKLLGRATGAETRGCSLMAEAFLAAVRIPS